MLVAYFFGSPCMHGGMAKLGGPRKYQDTIPTKVVTNPSINRFLIITGPIHVIRLK